MFRRKRRAMKPPRSENPTLRQKPQGRSSGMNIFDLGLPRRAPSAGSGSTTSPRLRRPRIDRGGVSRQTAPTGFGPRCTNKRSDTYIAEITNAASGRGTDRRDTIMNPLRFNPSRIKLYLKIKYAAAYWIAPIFRKIPGINNYLEFEMIFLIFTLRSLRKEFREI